MSEERTQPRPYREVLEKRRAQGVPVGPADASPVTAEPVSAPEPLPQGEFLPEPDDDEQEGE
ncbi:MAG: hypothetical protein WDA20_13165 [Desulfuromonadales bacterium]